MNPADVLTELHSVNLFSPKKLTDLELMEWSNFISSTIDDLSIDRLRMVFKLYSTGKLVWNNFDKIQNITHPLSRIRFIECLPDFYEELPNDVYRYAGNTYSTLEWDSFLHMKWNEYKMAQLWSAESIWNELVDHVSRVLPALESKSEGSSLQSKITQLKSICQLQEKND